MFKRLPKIFILFFLFLNLFILTSCNETNSKIEEVFDKLFQDVNLNLVETDLSFPKRIDNIDITYLSNKPEVISNDGKVIRQSEDVIVEITITLNDGTREVTKLKTITIIKIDLITEVFNNLFSAYDLNKVTTDLIFPPLVKGVNISYQSNNLDVVGNDGKINRGAADQTVRIKITLKSGNKIVEKFVDIIVIKDPRILIEQVYEKLFLNDDLNKVTNDLTFLQILDGVNLTWQSTNEGIITNAGKITRGISNQTVAVNLTLASADVIVNKVIDITVLKDSTLYIENVFTGLFENIDLSKVTSDLNFVSTVDEVIISYESEQISIITNNGVITRGSEDQEVKIIVYLFFDGITITKELFITVLKVIDYPVINAISSALNKTITIQGVIIGRVGLNYFIHDGDNGIYLYQLGNGYNIGDEIKVTGVRTEFNGLIQLSNNKNITVVNTNVLLPEANEIENLSQIKQQSTFYNIDNLIISDFDVTTSGKDIFITVKDNFNNSMEIIISKHTLAADVSKIASKLGNIAIGDKITLTNIVSSYYNKYQMQLFLDSQITIKHLSDEPIETNPIEPYYPDSKDMSFIHDELDKSLTAGLTPTGEANVLIIPINFTDYQISAEDLARLNLAFFGTSLDTGWESVKSYYNKSSYGKFGFNGQILEPYQANKASTYYANRYNLGLDADYEIIKAALDFYDAMIDYSIYDNDNDGYIDGLYFIYAAPTWYGDETGSANDSDLWWAYVYQYYTEEYEYYDGVEANYYLWAGIDFMDEAITYTDYTDEFIAINASTYIHETGHMLGLDDYYDYDKNLGPDGGLGGADMMDYTVGDHNSFSKIMLDWVAPLIVSGTSITVTLDSFTTSGDVILVSTNWNNTYFDEYFLIDFFSPTGLNEMHMGFNGLYSISGIRILHVNAQINNDQSEGELFLYNNSRTSQKILKPIEADNDNSIEHNEIAENSDLFQQGDIFGQATNYRLANGRLVNFNVKILNITSNSAEIEIIFN